MNCFEVEKLLPLLASRDLDGKIETRLLSHLEACEHCRSLAVEYEESGAWLLLNQPPHFDEPFTDGLRQSVLREISRVQSQGGWFESIIGGLRFRPVIAFAAAAVLLLSIVLYLTMHREQQPGTPEEARIESPQPVLGTDESEEHERDSSPKKAPEATVQKKRTIQRGSGSQIRIASATGLPGSTTALLLTAAEPQSGMLRIDLQTNDPSIRIIWFVSASELQSSSPIPGLD